MAGYRLDGTADCLSCLCVVQRRGARMTSNDWLQLVIFVVLLLVVAVPLGRYMSNVFDGSSRVLRWFGWAERGLYKVAGVDASKEMGWKTYTVTTLAFHGLGT